MRWRRSRRAIKNLERANGFLHFTLCAYECCMAKLVGAAKNLCPLLTFTEIFAPLRESVMLKNEGIRQKYPFFRKGRNYFEAECITCGYICTVCKEKKTIVTVDIEYQKLFSRSVTRWLSLYRNLPRMLPLYPTSNPYSIDKPTVVLKRFFGNSLSEFCSH